LALWKIAYHVPGTEIDPHRVRYFLLGLPTLGAEDHVVRRVNSVSRFTRSRKLSNRSSPCGKRSIRGIRLHVLWRKSRATDHFNCRNGVPREHCFKTDRSECAACQKPTSMASWALSSPVTSELPKITGPNLFEPHFSVSALIIKQFGRLFSA